MASKNNIYVVTMYKWANTGCHSYVLGVWNKKQAAIDAGEKERINRGGTKYYPMCLEFEKFGVPMEDVRIIVDLPEHPFMVKSR